MGHDALTRIIGGSPLAVLVRLVLLSIVVGFIIKQTGLDPWRVVEHILDALGDVIDYIRERGLEPLHSLWRYFLVGAAVVIPIWLLVRLTRGLGGK